MVFLAPTSAGYTIVARAWQAFRRALPRRHRLATLGAFAAPTLVASVAYVDPGNLATNIQSGALFGYRLLWVVVLANVMAMLFQALAAKLGIARGQSLARLCREQLPAPLVYPMWIVSEIGAMATDLAEFLGASVGLSLLFGLPLLGGAAAVGVATWAILVLHRRNFRLVEAIIAALVAIIALCYVVESVLAHPDWRAVIHHSLIPSLAGRDSIMLAAGIVGATVMPHAIFLHSSLARGRMPAADAAGKRRLVTGSTIDVVITLGLAGLVNMAMMYVAAAVFGVGGGNGSAGIETAYRTLGPLFGAGAAAAFMIGLLASGLSSSVVGTLAGQVIMEDFVGWRVPLWLRRLVTMLPSLAIIAWGIDPTDALILSQVVLSLVLPVPMVALVVFTSRRSIMGALANAPMMSAAAIAAALIIGGLNALILLDVAGIALVR